MSPSPLPPESERRWKRSNTRSSSSGGIPSPVSATVEHRVGAVRPDVDAHPPAGRRVPDGVRDEIDEDLAHPDRVDVGLERGVAVAPQVHLPGLARPRAAPRARRRRSRPGRPARGGAAARRPRRARSCAGRRAGGPSRRPRRGSARRGPRPSGGRRRASPRARPRSRSSGVRSSWVTSARSARRSSRERSRRSAIALNERRGARTGPGPRGSTRTPRLAVGEPLGGRGEVGERPDGQEEGAAADGDGHEERRRSRRRRSRPAATAPGETIAEQQRPRPRSPGP